MTMGIKNLSKIIKKLAPSGVSEICMENLRGKTLCIDVPIFMYKFTYIDPENPIKCFQLQLSTMQEFDITPIYIFDGVAAPIKAPELEKRRNLKRKAKDDLEDASQKLAKVKETSKDITANFANLADAHTQFQKAKKKVISVPSAESYTKLREYFTENNVKWMQAPHDAEKLAANLVSSGVAYGVVSEDFDTMPYLCGSKGDDGRLITGFTKPVMTMYRLKPILNQLQMDKYKFVDFCILSGCDLCSKIKNIAGKRAVTLIQAHGSIERIVRVIDTNKYQVPENFNYDAARREFGVLQD